MPEHLILGMVSNTLRRHLSNVLNIIDEEVAAGCMQYAKGSPTDKKVKAARQYLTELEERTK